MKKKTVQFAIYKAFAVIIVMVKSLLVHNVKLLKCAFNYVVSSCLQNNI